MRTTYAIWRRLAVAGILLLAAGQAAAQGDREAREAASMQEALQRCETSYQGSIQRICNAPVRARNPKLKQSCMDEMAQHHERCIASVQSRYDSAARRRARLQD